MIETTLIAICSLCFGVVLGVLLVDLVQRAQPVDGTQRTDVRPFGPPVNVRRTTTGRNGVVLEENHRLPAEVAHRLTGGAR